MQPCVHIAASRPRGTLYTGVTSDVSRRMWEHREGLLPGFTRTYGIKMLVYYEFHQTMEFAIAREKQVKQWQRAWKLRLIVSMNPDWDDLYEQLNW